MEEEFSLDVDENTINELKKTIGYDEIEARHKRFMEGKETTDDLINHIYHYEIKNDKGLDLYVVELKYYNKIIDLYNKEKEKNNKIYNFCRRELAFERRLKREKRKPDEFNQGRFYVCENIKEILTNKAEESD